MHCISIIWILPLWRDLPIRLNSFKSKDYAIQLCWPNVSQTRSSRTSWKKKKVFVKSSSLSTFGVWGYNFGEKSEDFFITSCWVCVAKVVSIEEVKHASLAPSYLPKSDYNFEVLVFTLFFSFLVVVTEMCRTVYCWLISGHKWQWVWLMPMNIDPKTVPTYYIHQFFMG